MRDLTFWNFWNLMVIAYSMDVFATSKDTSQDHKEMLDCVLPLNNIPFSILKTIWVVKLFQPLKGHAAHVSYSYCLYLLVDDYSEYKCLCISKYDLALIFIIKRNSPICDEYQTKAGKGFCQVIRICRHIMTIRYYPIIGKQAS